MLLKIKHPFVVLKPNGVGVRQEYLIEDQQRDWETDHIEHVNSGVNWAECGHFQEILNLLLELDVDDQVQKTELNGDEGSICICKAKEKITEDIEEEERGGDESLHNNTAGASILSISIVEQIDNVVPSEND